MPQKDLTMQRIAEVEAGFQSPLFSFYPLPQTNVGQVFTRKMHGVECTYLCKKGVPYSVLDRRWLEILTTMIVKEKITGRLELGGVTDTLRRFGMAKTNMYILPTRKAIQKIATLHVSSTIHLEGKGYKAIQGLDFTVAKKHQLFWGTGKADIAKPELFDKENWIEFSPEFIQICKLSAPHNQKDFLQIRSPLEQDLYNWLIGKLPQVKGSELIPWVWFYIQFGNGSILSVEEMKDLRKRIKKSLLSIKQNYYTTAKMEYDDAGIILRNSPPLIAPDSKEAGFSVFG